MTQVLSSANQQQEKAGVEKQFLKLKWQLFMDFWNI